MTLLVTDDKDGTSCEATGHPSSCTEPAPGTVEDSSHGVVVNDANGNEKPLATTASTLSFPSHAHSYSATKGCFDVQSHSVSSYNFSSSITINGEDVLSKVNSIATDPGSGGDINMVGSGINSSIQKQ
jgi:hypothetical protein